MNVAWGLCWGGSQGTKPCIFPCKVAAVGDETYLLFAAVAAAVGLPFFLPHCNGDVLLCDVKSHTTLHQCQFFCDVLLCDVKSHTALHQCQFFCDVLLCDVKSHPTLHQCQVSQFYLSVTRKYCFAISFNSYAYIIHKFLYSHTINRY